MDHVTPQTLSAMMNVTHKVDGTICVPDAGDFNAMHWNINHLTNKLHHVELYAASFPGILHFIAITESWLKEYNCSTYNLTNYTSYHLVRHNCDGGGITVFIHNSIASIPRKVISEITTPDLNHFMVIELPSVRATVAIVYRRPINTGIENFLEELQLYCLGIPQTLIMGDLNMNQLDNNLNNKLLNVIEVHGCGLLNEISHAAVTRLVSGTILDLAATNILNVRCKLSIIHGPASDHGIIFVSIGFKLKINRNHFTKTKVNLSDAAKKIEHLCDNSTIADGNELNVELERIVRESTTTIRVKSNHRIVKPYIDRQLLLAIRERDVLHTLMIRHPNNATISNKYTAISNYIKHERLTRRTSYECGRIEDAIGDDKKVWKIYKEVLFNQQNKVDSNIMVNGNVVSDSVSDCNLINEHFCTGGDKLATSIIAIHGYETNDTDELYHEHHGNNFAFVNVSADDVTEAVNVLPNKKSTGVDKVPFQLLKATIDKISPVIAFCFNLMVSSCVFPSGQVETNSQIRQSGY